MLRRAAVLKRICDRRRAQNAICRQDIYCNGNVTEKNNDFRLFKKWMHTWIG